MSIQSKYGFKSIQLDLLILVDSNQFNWILSNSFGVNLIAVTKKEEVFFCPFSNCEEPLETLFDVYEHMMIVLEIMSMKKAIAASKSQPTSELRQMLCTPRNTLLKAKSDSGYE